MDSKLNSIIDGLEKNSTGGVQWLEIGTIKQNARNPRKLDKSEKERLKESIKKFPQMLALRPGIIDENNVLLSNNQRYLCCVELGFKKFPVISAASLTDEQRKEFIIKDNTHAGQWDFEALKNDWEQQKVEDWGVIWEPAELDEDNERPAKKNLKHTKRLTLTFTESQHARVVKALNSIAETPEQAVLKLIQKKN